MQINDFLININNVQCRVNTNPNKIGHFENSFASSYRPAARLANSPTGSKCQSEPAAQVSCLSRAARWRRFIFSRALARAPG